MEDSFKCAKNIVRYLQIQYDGCTLLIDPYFSRLNLLQLLLPLKSNHALIDRYITQADYILIGHSHHDHIMDVLYIAAQHGATVIGSQTTCNILRGAHIPEAQLIEIGGGEEIQAGPFTISVQKSLHGKCFAGFVPFPGVIEQPLRKKTLWIEDLKEGKTWSYHITCNTVSLFYQSGGDVIDSELEGLHADILLTNVAARHKTFTKRILTLLRPRVLIPCHFDNFFLPFSSGLKYLPTVQFKKFLKEVHEIDPTIEIKVLDFFEEYTVDVMTEKMIHHEDTKKKRVGREQE